MLDQSPAAPAGGAVLPAKLSPPLLGFAPLSRPRLLRALSHGVSAGPVTLVAGPAGSGKTVLAASWVQANRGLPVAWLSLDPADDSPPTFRAALLAALDRAGVDLPGGAGLPAPGAPGWPVPLAAALASRRRQVVLVVDDADALTSRALTGALDLLVRHAGARLRLVLCARADPLLPLHRYRLDDRLTEIRTDQLAFTAEETGGLLASLGTPVPAGVAAALQRETEGWATALRLTAAPLARGVDPARLLTALTTEDGGVAQYLTAEVLDHQPAAVRRFLLRVSATRELWPGLVDALAGRPGGGRVLASLAAQNAFVERAAGAPGGFHIHALFRELLHAQLSYEAPARFTAGHRTCADWYAAAGDVPVAVEHARAAGDPDLAARLLVDDLAVGRLLASGTAGGPLPVDGGGPDAAVLRAAAALAGDRPAPPRDLTAAAAAAVGRDTRPALRVSAAVVCAVAAATGPAGDLGAAAAGAESLVAALPDEHARPRAELAAVLAAGQAGALRLTDVPERVVREANARALAAGRAAQAPRPSARCLADLALLEALVGRLRRATALAADHEALADERGLPEPERSPAAALAAAWAALDRHELDTAARGLDRAARRVPAPWTSGPLLTVLASRLQRARGRPDAAPEVLDPVLATAGLPAWVREHVLAEAVRVSLARRDGPAARERLDRLPAGSPRGRVLRVTAAALGLPPRAGEVLPASDAGGPLPLGLAVEDAVARACLLSDGGDPRGAVAVLGHALQLAGPERLRRPFLDAPPRLRSLLRAAPSLAVAGAWLGPTGPAVPAPRRPVDPLAGAPPAAITGELSPREREVLQLLAGMLSTAEVAATLFVSVNTVRTHVRSILRKLGATRRNEAVRRARELHLLEDTGARTG